MEPELITEELNIGDNLEELIESNNPIDFDNDMNIFYSYPYFSDDQYDYQYRLFIDEGEFILEDIKSDETDMNIDQSITVLNAYPKCELTKGLDFISKGYDLRNLETEMVMTISTDTINYDSADDIENNKNIVLLELYKTIF